jgi:hypothetical protein
MSRIKGDWAKITGGNHGAYYDKKWLAFECLYCARVDGILVRRLNLGSVSVYVNRALRQRYAHKCGGVEKHKEFFKMMKAAVKL